LLRHRNPTEIDISPTLLPVSMSSSDREKWTRSGKRSHLSLKKNGETEMEFLLFCLIVGVLILTSEYCFDRIGLRLFLEFKKQISERSYL